MNYSKLSDFEINRLVASAQSLLINDEQCASLKVKSSSVLVNDIVSSFEFNPCKNPSHSWPIIVENNIDFRYEFEEEGVPCALISDGEDYLFWHSDKNRLRAAMIVYLMMQEQK